MNCCSKHAVLSFFVLSALQDKVGNSASEKVQRLSLQDQQQHGSSRHQLVTL